MAVQRQWVSLTAAVHLDHLIFGIQVYDLTLQHLLLLLLDLYSVALNLPEKIVNTEIISTVLFVRRMVANRSESCNFPSRQYHSVFVFYAESEPEEGT